MEFAQALDPRLAAALVAVGAVVATIGFVRLVAHERALARRDGANIAPAPWFGPGERHFVWLLAAAVVAAIIVRAVGIDVKSLSHPEIYIPGIDLPPGISEPPPRHGLWETAAWHFHGEPHPFGYFLAMWAWTKAFGTSVVALRLPAAIFGVAAVVAIYRVGSRVYGSRTGVVAAILLALHGFAILWSQMARMYSQGMFLGLVSTGLLVELSRSSRRRPLLEAAYVASIVACALTVEFTWPLLLAQLVWAALPRRSAPLLPMRVIFFQTLAIILAAPMIAHIMMLARGGATEPTTFWFIVEYFSFGFLFSLHEAHGLVGLPAAAVLSFGLAFLWRGLVVAPANAPPISVAAPPVTWSLVPCAVGSAIIMLGFADLAYQRVRPLYVASLIPLLAIGVPLLVVLARQVLASHAPRLDQFIAAHDRRIGLVAFLAVVPPVGLYLISYKVAIAAERAFLIFVPYLLIVIAAGIVALARRRVVGAVAIAALGVVFTGGFILQRGASVSPVDYKALGGAISAQAQLGDLVFVRPRHWDYTPVFYYLDPRMPVATDYADALRLHPAARVWLMSVGRFHPTADAIDALAGYRATTIVTVAGSMATLYLPPDGSSPRAPPGHMHASSATPAVPRQNPPDPSGSGSDE